MKITETEKFIRIHVECGKEELDLKNEFFKKAYGDLIWRFVRSGPKIDKDTFKCVPNVFLSVLDINVPQEHLLESQQNLMQRTLEQLEKDPN